MSGGGRTCAVPGCYHNEGKLRKWRQTQCIVHPNLLGKDCPCLEPYKFFAFPKQEKARLIWIKAINRSNFQPTKYSRVCSVHFHDGKPTEEYPNPRRRELGYDVEVKEEESTSAGNSPSVLHVPTTPADCPMIVQKIKQEHDDQVDLVPKNNSSLFENTNLKTFRSVGSQTNDETIYFHTYSATEPFSKSVCIQADTPDFGFMSHITTDKICKFYTGIGLDVFNSLVQSLVDRYKPNFKMLLSDQILIVLMRLRLGLLFQDLALRFNISQQLASKIFSTWLPILANHLRDLTIWLPRDVIKATMPDSFKKNYPNTTCIIDCFEVFLQRSYNFKAKAQTYSTYKSHNTCKNLIAIAPSGFIMFISKAYGGRASDRLITSDSGFLNNLLPGDEVMADRGFTIADELIARRVKLNIPAFMEGTAQLSELQTTETQRPANLRIHMERVICRLKCYRILSSNLKIKSIKTINEIMTVCGGLCNLRTHSAALTALNLSLSSTNNDNTRHIHSYIDRLQSVRSSGKRRCK